MSFLDCSGDYSPIHSCSCAAICEGILYYRTEEASGSETRSDPPLWVSLCSFAFLGLPPQCSFNKALWNFNWKLSTDKPSQTSACPHCAVPSSLTVSCSEKSSSQRSQLDTVSSCTDCLEIKDLRASIKFLNRTRSKSTTIHCGSHRAEGKSNGKYLMLDSEKYSQI